MGLLEQILQLGKLGIRIPAFGVKLEQDNGAGRGKVLQANALRIICDPVLAIYEQDTPALIFPRLRQEALKALGEPTVPCLRLLGQLGRIYNAVIHRPQAGAGDRKCQRYSQY